MKLGLEGRIALVTGGSKGIGFACARLLAVVTLRSGEAGRHYRLPIPADYEAVWKAQQHLVVVAAQPLQSGLSRVPNEPTPAGGGSGGAPNRSR